MAEAIDLGVVTSTAPVRRRSLARPALGLSLVLAILTVVAPGALAAVVQPVVDMIETIRVGQHTQIVRQAPHTETAAEVADTLGRLARDQADGKRWHLPTPYIGFGGRVPAGKNAIIQQVSSLTLLRSLTPLKLPLPSGLVHRGQPVRFSHAEVAPDGQVFVFLGSGADELMVAMYPAGNGTVSISFSTGRNTPQGGVVIDSPELKTEEISRGARIAVWKPAPEGFTIDQSSLHWQEAGTSYSLWGRALTREEAVAFLAALPPLE